MILQGIIKSIDYNENKCIVRIPSLEGAGNKEEINLDAVFCISPGQFNNFKIDDSVFIGFEYNKLELPVILGKQYEGITKEIDRSIIGATAVGSLVVNNTAILPANTAFINIDSITNGKLSDDKLSISQIINAIKELNKKTDELNTQLNTLVEDKLKAFSGYEKDKEQILQHTADGTFEWIEKYE